MLQESELEAANEYLSALKAHNSYFHKRDVAAFLVSIVTSAADGPDEEQPGQQHEQQQGGHGQGGGAEGGVELA